MSDEQPCPTCTQRVRVEKEWGKVGEQWTGGMVDRYIPLDGPRVQDLENLLLRVQVAEGRCPIILMKDIAAALEDNYE